jgi:molybdopterin converting factor small subunit
MKVHVKSFAHLRLALGQSPLTLEMPEGSTVADLIETLVEKYGEPARDAIWKRVGEELKITPVNDGKSIPLDAPLQDDMTVVFMSIVAAG